jgi:hypothetical protein
MGNKLIESSLVRLGSIDIVHNAAFVMVKGCILNGTGYELSVYVFYMPMHNIKVNIIILSPTFDCIDDVKLTDNPK